MSTPIVIVVITFPPTLGWDLLSAIREIAGGSYREDELVRNGVKCFRAGCESVHPYKNLVVVVEGKNENGLIITGETYTKARIRSGRWPIPFGQKFTLPFEEKDVLEFAETFSQELKRRLEGAS